MVDSCQAIPGTSTGPASRGPVTRLRVTYFHRKPRANANFSIEGVFEGVRHELTNDIFPQVCVAPCRSNGLLRRLWIAWHARRHQGDINHVTGDTNFTALSLDGRRTILTNHDCGYLVRTNGIRRWILLQFWLKLPVRRVAAVTTVSNQIKDEIVRYAGCPPEKIIVIPNPVSPAFQYVEKPFNRDRPRILHIGTAPNKNLPRLAEAIAGLACRLVIVGEIREGIRESLEKNGIEYENHMNLSSSDMVRQYQACDIVSFVSLYEGFGMPILEAQAVGRPVVTSNRAPMTDVAAHGACLVDPEDPASIRAGIERVVRDDTYREQVIANGLANVKRFQPDQVAKQYLDLYRRVFDESGVAKRGPLS